MTAIEKASLENIQLLVEIGRSTFLESHGHSASAKDIDVYVRSKFNDKEIRNELSDPGSIFHIIYHNAEPAGYSKIILNTPHQSMKSSGVTKLERLYMLKKYYSMKLGLTLFNYIVELSKQSSQSGMWLFVWTENHRAIRFYNSAGFEIIGRHDFKISESHSNPNYIMLLNYDMR